VRSGGLPVVRGDTEYFIPLLPGGLQCSSSCLWSPGLRSATSGVNNQTGEIVRKMGGS
jgi:hypothetical protein